MKMKKQNSNDVRPIPDDENPDFLFSTTVTKLLSDIATGKINARKLAQRELRKRGQNYKGNWIGCQFQKVAEDPCKNCDGILQCKDCHVFKSLHK